MAYTSASPGPATSSSGISLDRLLRKLFPSTSKLTFNPLFRMAVNAGDVVPRLVFPEFRSLPPNHLRIRVGVGNRIFNNQTHFLVHARDFWMFALSEGIVNLQSNILDIGVGCGRWAHWMRDCNFRGRRFAGAYVGVDIDGEAIAWCQKNYDAERFRFYHSSHASVSYNQNGSASPSYRIPEADGTFDLVFSNSLLTHLLEAELGNYLRETFRLLQAGGTMMHSHFNMEHLPATYGKRHTFGYQLGNARIESEAQPEAAVAYHTDYLFRLCRQIGFSSCEIVHMPGGEQHQPILLCRK
jgi:2-polyprenyl-3-methyl-5-hydroxy-6-metoxy-1,4-benzoquinol methylase